MVPVKAVDCAVCWPHHYVTQLCIDPGHGMSNRSAGVFDPGAVADGVREADITLAFALAIKHFAPEFGVEVILTRNSNVIPAPLGERTKMAARTGCECFISLHCNAGPFSARGVETFYQDDPEFALRIHRSVARAIPTKDRGVKHESASSRRRLAVLDFPGPACLVELGFLSNPADRLLLQERATRINVARAILGELKLR